MRAYSEIEKDFMKIIVEKTPASDAFFQRTLSDNFFVDGFRPFVLIEATSEKIILFFSKGKRYKQFFSFFTLVGLMEELERLGLIIRLPINQETYFIGELFADAYQEQVNGKARIVSRKTGQFIEFPDLSMLYSRSGEIKENLDPVAFNDPKFFKRLSYTFSGIVYPTEALRDLVQNNCRSVDDRRHRRTMVAAWAGIGLSIILSLSPLAKAIICDIHPFSYICNDSDHKEQ